MGQEDAEKDAAQLLQLLRDLRVDSGDVVVFDRACASMSMYGGAICVCAKFFGNTQWDHNGVVVRDPNYAPHSSGGGEKEPDDGSHSLYLMEATLTGVKMRPLVERLMRSKSYDIAVRKLQVHRSPDFLARTWEFAHAVMNSPYEDRPQMMFNAGVKVPTRLERERIFDALVSKKKELANLDSDLAHRLNMPEFERNALLQEREAVHDRYHALVEQLSLTERSIFENERIAQPHAKNKMFCSQLVAGMYQHLGLLLPYPSANSYLPKHFSSNDGGGYMKLQQDATFLPEISLRRHLQVNFEEQRRLAQEQEMRGPQTPEEINTIVRCLRRHQLFHTLSESELIRISRQFRRRTLTDGEVVFYQGTEGDFFYIIEQGECDVFVDYDHLQKTQEGDESDANPTSTSKKAPSTRPLQRRKTLSLPEFQDASSLAAVNERVHVATNGPGRAFGESALIYGTPRRATLRATVGASAPSSDGSSHDSPKHVVLWKLDKQTFRDVVEAHPASQHSMEEHLFLMKAIADHPLFSELDERAKALAVRKLFPLHVRAGTAIINQGDSGDYFYVIESGKCEISRKKPKWGDAAFVDRVIGKGASFGEAALLYNSRRGASVNALEDTKVWCMDRASFLTITRSGSAALLKLFRKVSSNKPKDTHETFATQSDLRRMLKAPKKLRKRWSLESGRQAPAQSAALPPKNAYERAMQLGFALLFHDASGVINFSQFAHFHITLGASNIEQLLPEAAFRIVKSLVPGSNNNAHGSTADQGSIKLSDLRRSVRKWIGVNDELGANEVEGYERLFDLQPLQQSGAEHSVTQDDLARAIGALSDLNDDESGDTSELQQAKDELKAFVAALKHDIDALRTVWHAAELQAGGVDDDANQGKKQLTFDSNLKSGWISAIRHNPTGGDWEYLQPSHENDDDDSPSEHDPEFSKKKVWAQLTSFSAAIAAGALARTATAPLERLKILMQVATPSPKPSAQAPYMSLPRGLINMVKLSGARSLYSGNLTHCLWVIPSLPTKFLLCDIYRNQLANLVSSDRNVSTNLATKSKIRADASNLLAGGLAGLTANCLFYPLDVVRGRLSVQQYYNADQQYRGIRDCFRTMHRTEGVRAFYRGFAPASVGVFAYIGCNYSMYEFLRPSFILYDTDSAIGQLGHPSIPGQILCATTASLTAQSIAYPFDVIRRRMQLQGSWHSQLTFPTYSSSWNCVAETMREEPKENRRWRFRALYRGVFVNSVKALPSAVISFLSYEKIREMQVKADSEYEA
uniref:Cyclic nucleotide-binding domain-containing protein n=1 Tax=Globisporangium ultimum (strain ATCC 200006 / CBS 805.95 / DAOM BR144) TaxID=431595 RepID=K3W553_GLOUD